MRTILVEPYNAKWPIEFDKIKHEIDYVLKYYVISIEHVGSTSVQGLWAKPIIIDRLARLGYIHKGDQRIKGREAFDYNAKEKSHLMTHHLYVCDKDNPELKRHCALRDYLRQHPEEGEKYSQIKREMAEKYPHDIDAYIEGKEPVILEIYKKCGVTSSE